MDSNKKIKQNAAHSAAYTIVERLISKECPLSGKKKLELLRFLSDPKFLKKEEEFSGAIFRAIEEFTDRPNLVTFYSYGEERHTKNRERQKN